MKAIISGASRGIGRAVAKELAHRGYDLILIARNKKPLEQLAEELTEKKVKVKTIAADLSKETSFKELENQLQAFDKIDLLINNLGVYRTEKADQIKISDLKENLEINLYSAIQLTQLALPKLKSNQQPTAIINIGSVMSLKADKNASIYSMSKHAFKAWNDSLRKEVRKLGIKVSCLYPGAVNTSSWDGVDVNRSKMIQAEDIGKLVGAILEMKSNTLIEEVKLSPI